MKVGTVVAVVVLAAAAVGGTYWITRPDSPPPPDTSKSPTALDLVEEEPVPSKTGPHPKVVVPEERFEFGSMKVGETRKHDFVVRNEGQAPLKLGKPHTTCQCTISEAAKNEIPPGGEGTITLSWTPAAVNVQFDKGAVIRTNDPQTPEIRLTVLGVADKPIRTEPEGAWQMGGIAGDRASQSVGVVFSRLLDDFKITSIESSNPLLTADTEPLPEEVKKDMGAKTGYKVRTTVAPGMPVGPFSETLKIQTDAADEEVKSVTVQVTGTRRGPIQTLPTPGTKWSPEAMAMDLGRFPSSQGASGTVSIFVSGLPEGEDLKVEKVECDVPYVKHEFKKDEGFKSPTRQRYMLTFSVPPNSPPAAHRSDNAAHVTITTNHPEAKEMKFRVSFISAP